MSTVIDRWIQQWPCKPLLLLALFSVIFTACSTSPRNSRVLFDEAYGTVALRPISNQSIQASHPIHLEPALIARVLSGMRIQEHHRTLQEILAGPSTAVPVFSEEAIKFLAPRVSTALTTAGTGEAVTFRVANPRRDAGRLEQAITETTAGSLYAYGLSLYVTLSQYRYAATQTHMDGQSHRHLPDTSNLANRTLLFIPSAAQRSDDFHPPAEATFSGQFLAIDYQRLQDAPPSVSFKPAPLSREPLTEIQPSTTPDQPTEISSQRDAEILALKNLVIKKDLELETLRDELRALRKQLDDRNRAITPQQ